MLLYLEESLSMLYGSDKTCYYFWGGSASQSPVPPSLYLSMRGVRPGRSLALGGITISQCLSFLHCWWEEQLHSIHPGNRSVLEPCLEVLALKKTKWLADVDTLLSPSSRWLLVLALNSMATDSICAFRPSPDRDLVWATPPCLK